MSLKYRLVLQYEKMHFLIYKLAKRSTVEAVEVCDAFSR
jgi:hypothetical protein